MLAAHLRANYRQLVGPMLEPHKISGDGSFHDLASRNVHGLESRGCLLAVSTAKIEILA